MIHLNYDKIFNHNFLLTAPEQKVGATIEPRSFEYNVSVSIHSLAKVQNEHNLVTKVKELKVMQSESG